LPSVDEITLIGATDPFQVTVNDIVEMEIGKPICDSDHLAGIGLSILAGVNNMNTYDQRTLGSRILAKVLQEISVRHPRGHHAQLVDVESRAESRDYVGVV